jgi:hypothetical protein
VPAIHPESPPPTPAGATFIVLSNNQLTGFKPASQGGFASEPLAKLQTLQVDVNQFHDINDLLFILSADNYDKFSFLTSVNFDYNAVNGSIPIGKYLDLISFISFLGFTINPSLLEIGLRYNQLSGFIDLDYPCVDVFCLARSGYDTYVLMIRLIISMLICSTFTALNYNVALVGNRLDSSKQFGAISALNVPGSDISARYAPVFALGPNYASILTIDQPLQDVDECAFKTHDCNQTCATGWYACSCVRSHSQVSIVQLHVCVWRWLLSR